MNVDQRGVLHGMKHGILAMLETGGGSIINWSSIGGLDGSAGTSVYSAAKAGVIGATKVGAIEYGATGSRTRSRRSAPSLASDRASFVTGAVIPVDGGWTVKLA